MDTMTSWDPTQYARFADHRNRPFFELLGRVGATAPRLVGVDNALSMLAAARELDAEGRVEWVEADLATWEVGSLGAAPDVIVSNAALQWVPGHLPLIEGWVAGLADDGWFALQVPGNFGAPSHRLMREIAREQERSVELEGAL